MSNRSPATLWTLTAAGTVLQIAMVVAGNFSPTILNLSGPLGMSISLLVGLLYGLNAATSFADAVRGGAITGGVGAFIGIGVAYLLGNAFLWLFAFGTASSAVAGILGAVAVFAAVRRRRQLA
ncbi:MAG TPA: hypothetical protein VHG28_15440 [Longimicrobiaceae bacterium]|nr:hypothetical protein [Longimicrobiaceae bacterium]